MEERTLHVVWANICQGFAFKGGDADHHVHGEYCPGLYSEALDRLSPDVLGLCEVPMDSYGDSPLIGDLLDRLGMASASVLPLAKGWLKGGLPGYGIALLSKWKALSISECLLKAPPVSAEGPDGTPWVMHNKGAQRMVFEVDSKLVAVDNVHFFPAHHFGLSLTDPVFREERERLDAFLASGEGALRVVAGDFNNRTATLATLFPRMCASGVARDALSAPTLRGSDFQVDHVMYGEGLEVKQMKIMPSLSDHHIASVTFCLGG